MTIRHKFVSQVTDANDPTIVGPDDWNEDHEGGTVGFQLIAKPHHMANIEALNGNAVFAGGVYIAPTPINSPMYVMRLVCHMSAAASGTFQWGLFDYQANPSAATKVAGGSGSLNGTGLQSIPATGAPVLVGAGEYMLMLHAPNSNQGSMFRATTIASTGYKSTSSYTWTDTPNFTTGWSTSVNVFQMYLEGQLGPSAAW